MTADDTLTFSGTAVANAQVVVYLDNVIVGNTTADAAGVWTFSYASTVLARGTYVLNAVAVVEGESSALSDDFEFSVIPPVNWTDGSGDDQWLTSANWINNQGANVLPGPADYARIGNVDGPNSVNLTSSTEIGLLHIIDETVSVSDATLTINGIPELDSSRLTGNARLNLDSGAVLALGDVLEVDGIVQLSGGTIRNGTVKIDSGAGGGLSFASFFSNNTLDNVTVWGALVLDASNENLSIRNGFTLLDESGAGPGLLNLGGGGSVFGAYVQLFGERTLDNMEVVYDSTSGESYLYFVHTDGETLTLGPDLLLHGGYGALYATGSGTGTILLQGTLSADVAGRSLTVYTPTTNESFTVDSSGVVEAINGGRLSFSGAGTVTNNNQMSVTGGSILTLGGTFDNNGTVTAVDSTLQLNDNWNSVDGTISARNSTVELGGSFTPGDLGNFERGSTSGIDADDGTVRLVGTLDLEGGQFTLNAVTGPWEMMGGTFVNGTVKIDSGSGGGLSFASFSPTTRWTT